MARTALGVLRGAVLGDLVGMDMGSGLLGSRARGRETSYLGSRMFFCIDLWVSIAVVRQPVACLMAAGDVQPQVGLLMGL